MDTTELRRLLSEANEAKRADQLAMKSDTFTARRKAERALQAAAINALPHLLAVVEAATVLDHAQQPWASGHGPNGPTVDAAWRDLRNALRALEAGR